MQLTTNKIVDAFLTFVATLWLQSHGLLKILWISDSSKTVAGPILPLNNKISADRFVAVQVNAVTENLFPLELFM